MGGVGLQKGHSIYVYRLFFFFFRENLVDG